MPSYGSLHSPSLRKMNGGIDGNSRRLDNMRPVDLDNILGDPFALATISISVLAWLVAFVGSVVSTAEKLVPDFPNYSWFALAYMLCCILGIIIVLAQDTAQNYHIAIVGFLACGLVLTTSSTNSLVYSADGAKHTVAAGHIVLSMVNIVWIFYFGSTPTATPRAYLDSFAIYKDRQPSVVGRGVNSEYNIGRPGTSISSTTAPQMYSSSQQAGLKSSMPTVPTTANGIGSEQNVSQQRFTVPGPTTNNNLGAASQINNDPSPLEVGVPTEYPYRAKAIYSYEANPEDANEISFAKHELLEVSDVSGRWWQAKKENGETGIAPSNYLILL
ncbi:putative sh3-domain-containing protein [Erysiphe necator]|uniref:Putative sh3-domain-containing protein n=1 Tax=Uncinula necator TaxID=52586 RepID=A0A0B1P9L7_UNCNE|nr:putative sh3-domain-containing protein [Erysiphe necator]